MRAEADAAPEPACPIAPVVDIVFSPLPKVKQARSAYDAN